MFGGVGVATHYMMFDSVFDIYMATEVCCPRFFSRGVSDRHVLVGGGVGSRHMNVVTPPSREAQS